MNIRHSYRFNKTIWKYTNNFPFVKSEYIKKTMTLILKFMLYKFNLRSRTKVEIQYKQLCLGYLIQSNNKKKGNININPTSSSNIAGRQLLFDNECSL